MRRWIKLGIFMTGVFFSFWLGSLFFDDDRNFFGFFEGNVFVRDKKGNVAVEKDGAKNKVEPEEEKEDEDKGGDDFEGTTDALIVLINKERFDRELKPLKKNILLTKSAQDKAEDMIKNGYFEHISPGGIQPWFFAEMVGYRYENFGENIAEKYLSANSVHKAFMDSVGHRENILNENFRDVGVAIVPFENSDQKKFLVVEHFGSYLKDVDFRKKCGDTNKRRCRVQEKKKKELTVMVESWRRFLNKEREIKAKEEGRVDRRKKGEREGRMVGLKKITKDLEEYLSICRKIEEECR